MPDAPPPEFAFIARHFAPLAGPHALGLRDDAAVLPPRPGRALVIAADAMVEHVHFLPDDPPDDLGRKLLRTNLSDLAAMGAAPTGYLMTLAIPPGRDDAFFAAFAAGLADDQARFGLSLLGGDTVSTAGPLAMSLTILGEVEPGAEIRRAGARAGDGLWVSGTIGRAGLGLRARRGDIEDPDGSLVHAYRLPQPRLGLARAGIVRAAIDVSDGLLQDAGHLAAASGLGLEIEPALVPLAEGHDRLGPDERWWCLSCGDDYELLAAVAPDDAAALCDPAFDPDRVGWTRIGRFTEGDGIALRGPGADSVPERRGFSHISDGAPRPGAPAA